jgi:hypothetical protein
MAALSILNALPNYNTFSPKLTLGDYFRWGFQTHMNPIFAREIRKRAWQAGKVSLALEVGIAISINKVIQFLLGTIKNLLPQESLYRIKSKLMKPESEEEGQKR